MGIDITGNKKKCMGIIDITGNKGWVLFRDDFCQLFN